MTKPKVKPTEREKELKFQLNQLIKTNNDLLKKLHESETRLNERAKSAGAMRVTIVRERYEASLVKQERDALRKAVVVLVEAGRFPEPAQPMESAQSMTVAFDEDRRDWKIDIAQAANSL